MKNLNRLPLFLVLFLVISSCSSRYIKVVNPDTKTAFGITLKAPAQAIFFVENVNVTGDNERHTNLANSLYNQYGPATDKRVVGRTDAKQLKFILKDKTYLIDITKLKKRTALILFDGKNKPIIEYKTKKYRSLIQRHFGS
ncbi:hypothetical protein [Myroides fluvii]|uniref:hypothetical protein n=1 Tax=Myroides fluvii TaxID=2572594 RepID=UPI00131DB41B|nr:hypothetical protein [Myroides fluvii]